MWSGISVILYILFSNQYCNKDKQSTDNII